MERSAQTVATCLALSAYAIAMIAGIGAQNPVLLVMRRGLVVLVLGYAIGLAIGTIVEHILREHIAGYQAKRPIPDIEAIERAAVQNSEIIEAA